MAKLTLETQISAIGAVLNRFNLSKAERQQLGAAEQTLKSLVALRKTILATANNGNEEGLDVSDHLCDEIVKLLDLPTLPTGE